MPISENEPASAKRGDRKIGRVFVAEPNSRYDLDDAERYGRVVYIDTRQEFSIFQTDAMLDAVFDRLTEMEFDPEVDYFCLAGHIITVALVYGTLIQRYQRVHTLMYDARASTYVERLVEPRWE